MASAWSVAVGVLFLCVLTPRTSASCADGCRCFHVDGLRGANCTSLNGISTIAPRLEVLRLSQNHPILGAATFALFPNLKRLYLDQNGLHNLHPGAFRGLNHLEVLDLSHNHLSVLSEIAEAILDVPKLRKLRLRGNPIADIRSASSFLTSKALTFIDLGACKIHTIPDDAFLSLTNLRHLKLDGNLITTFKASAFPRSIISIDMSDNNIKDLSISQLSTLDNLDRFELSGNPLHCTCHLLNIRGEFVMQKPVVCNGPKEFKGINLMEVSRKELCELKTSKEGRGKREVNIDGTGSDETTYEDEEAQEEDIPEESKEKPAEQVGSALESDPDETKAAAGETEGVMGETEVGDETAVGNDGDDDVNDDTDAADNVEMHTADDSENPDEETMIKDEKQESNSDTEGHEMDQEHDNKLTNNDHEEIEDPDDEMNDDKEEHVNAHSSLKTGDEFLGESDTRAEDISNDDSGAIPVEETAEQHDESSQQEKASVDEDIPEHNHATQQEDTIAKDEDASDEVRSQEDHVAEEQVFAETPEHEAAESLAEQESDGTLDGVGELSVKENDNNEDRLQDNENGDHSDHVLEETNDSNSNEDSLKNSENIAEDIVGDGDNTDSNDNEQNIEHENLKAHQSDEGSSDDDDNNNNNEPEPQINDDSLHSEEETHETKDAVGLILPDIVDSNEPENDQSEDKDDNSTANEEAIADGESTDRGEDVFKDESPTVTEEEKKEEVDLVTSNDEKSNSEALDETSAVEHNDSEMDNSDMSARLVDGNSSSDEETETDPTDENDDNNEELLVDNNHDSVQHSNSEHIQSVEVSGAADTNNEDDSTVGENAISDSNVDTDNVSEHENEDISSSHIEDPHPSEEPEPSKDGYGHASDNLLFNAEEERDVSQHGEDDEDNSTDNNNQDEEDDTNNSEVSSNGENTHLTDNKETDGGVSQNDNETEYDSNEDAAGVSHDGTIHDIATVGGTHENTDSNEDYDDEKEEREDERPESNVVVVLNTDVENETESPLEEHADHKDTVVVDINADSENGEDKDPVSNDKNDDGTIENSGDKEQSENSDENIVFEDDDKDEHPLEANIHLESQGDSKEVNESSSVPNLDDKDSLAPEDPGVDPSSTLIHLGDTEGSGDSSDHDKSASSKDEDFIQVNTDISVTDDDEGSGVGIIPKLFGDDESGIDIEESDEDSFEVSTHLSSTEGSGDSILVDLSHETTSLPSPIEEEIMVNQRIGQVGHMPPVEVENNTSKLLEEEEITTEGYKRTNIGVLGSLPNQDVLDNERSNTENVTHTVETTEGVDILDASTEAAVVESSTTNNTHEDIIEHGSVNELGTPESGPPETPNKAAQNSAGSYVVLGIIMTVIVLLLGYSVYRSRRQRSTPQKKDVENPGRELQEVSKPLMGNGHAPEKPPRDDTRQPLMPKGDSWISPPEDDDEKKPMYSNGINHTPNVKDSNEHLENEEKKEVPEVVVEKSPNMLTSAPPSSTFPFVNHSKGDNVVSNMYGPTNDAGDDEVFTNVPIAAPRTGASDPQLQVNGSAAPVGNGNGLSSFQDPPVSPNSGRVRVVAKELPDSVAKRPVIIMNRGTQSHQDV